MPSQSIAGGDLTAIPQLVAGSGKEQNRCENLLTTQNITERSGPLINRVGSRDLFGISPCSLRYGNMEYLLLFFRLWSYSFPMRVQLDVGLARPLQIRQLKTCSYQKTSGSSAYNRLPVPACGPGWTALFPYRACWRSSVDISVLLHCL